MLCHVVSPAVLSTPAVLCIIAMFSSPGMLCMLRLLCNSVKAVFLLRDVAAVTKQTGSDWYTYQDQHSAFKVVAFDLMLRAQGSKLTSGMTVHIPASSCKLHVTSDKQDKQS